MLPCNIIIQETPGGIVQVSAINPMESMKSVANPNLEEVALTVSGKLAKVLSNLN